MSLLLAVLMVVLVLFACGKSTPTLSDEELYEANYIDHRTWCDSILHRDADCSKYGLSNFPRQAATKEEVEHLAWCNSIYHQNVGCPMHGQVVIPAEVLAKQLAEHNDWCNSIDHRNVGCPGYDATLAE